MSYDKRYSEDQIKRIRQWASGSMFFVMFFLCIGVAKSAYWIGHQDGYADGYQARLFEDVKPATSFVPAPPKAIAARLDQKSTEWRKKNWAGGLLLLFIIIMLREIFLMPWKKPRVGE